MASVIKAGRVIPSGTAVRHVEFNLEDVSRNAAHYLDTVKRQAAQILTEARQQSRTVLAQAVQQGHQAAEQAALKAAREEVALRCQTLLPALQQAIEAAAQAKDAWIQQWERDVVRLAVAIAQRVIRRELTRQPEISKQWIREALELASGAQSITLLLHPDDYAALDSHREQIKQQFNQVATAKIVADPDISPGGCRVVTNYGTIDQQIEAQLARIEQEATM